jgi:hypothetical protein
MSSDSRSSDRPTPNRRQTLRRRPNRLSKVACFKGTLGLGINLALEMLDVSERGIRLRVKEALAPGQPLEIHLSGLAHRKPLKVIARVVWCSPAEKGGYWIGCQFERTLSYADLQLLL